MLPKYMVKIGAGGGRKPQESGVSRYNDEPTRKGVAAPLLHAMAENRCCETCARGSMD
jgi:hypothetical protein